jgi:hypothetical protein
MIRSVMTSMSAFALLLGLMAPVLAQPPAPAGSAQHGQHEDAPAPPAPGGQTARWAARE